MTHTTHTHNLASRTLSISFCRSIIRLASCMAHLNCKLECEDADIVRAPTVHVQENRKHRQTMTMVRETHLALEGGKTLFVSLVRLASAIGRSR